MAVLIITSGKLKGRRLRLSSSPKEILFGRDPECQVQLKAEGVSLKHCVVQVTSEGVSVQDLNSENGTFVNDQRVAKLTRLAPGDVLRVGPIAFQFADEVHSAGDSEKPAAKPQAVTEDSIVDWLVGDGPSESSAGPVEVPVATTGSGTVAAESAIPKQKKKFTSVAAEGDDIIRRWLRMQQDKNAPDA